MITDEKLAEMFSALIAEARGRQRAALDDALAKEVALSADIEVKNPDYIMKQCMDERGRERHWRETVDLAMALRSKYFAGYR